MQCNKCRGLCHPERSYSILDNAYFHIFRCLNCGNIIDEIIVENKANPPKLPSNLTAQQRYYLANKDLWDEARLLKKYEKENKKRGLPI